MDNSPGRNSNSPSSLSNTSRLARILSQPPSSPSPVSLFNHINGGSNGGLNRVNYTRTPSPAVSLGPIAIVTPIMSMPSNSPQNPHEFGLNGFNTSGLSLLSRNITENGESHSVFLGVN